MTASCSNSDDDNDVTPTQTTSGGPEPAPISFRTGSVYTGVGVDDALATIATGDFNGDGDIDLALGAASADGEDGVDAGKVYVFFSAAEDRNLAVEKADAVFSGLAGDQTGRSLAAADLNGDGVDDLVIGAPAADVEGRADAGRVYVLVGNPAFELVRAAELVPNAPAISGADAGDFFGYTLTTGDFNNDRIDDLAIGAFLGDGPDNEREDAGEVYVIYGGNPPANLDLASEQIDVTIYGPAAGDHFSEGLTSGDFNGDGRDDIIAAATFADSGETEDAGETFILTEELSMTIDLNGNAPGVRVIGIDEGDQLGHSLAALDFNGDGFDDVLLGAVSADGPDNGADLAGEVALVLGSADPPSTIEAEGEAPIIYGLAGSRLGRAVAAGDLDGDGFDDAVLGASEATNGDGTPETGAAYVVFGNPDGQLPSSVEAAALAIYGAAEGDNLGTQVNGIPALVAADINRDNLADVIVAAPRADENRGTVAVYFSEAAR